MLYLLEDSPEAVAMRQNITNMLESGNQEQTLLALQLLKGGGVHSSHLAYVLAFSRWQKHFWKNAEKIKASAKLLFVKYAPEEMQARQQAYPLPTARQMNKRQANQPQNFTRFIKEYAQETGLDADVLAIVAFVCYDYGVVYLLQKPLRDVRWVLGYWLDNFGGTGFYFENWGLSALPAEVGEFPEVTSLDLCGNPLTDLPDSLQNLQKVSHLNFDNNLPQLVCEKLARFFPEAMANECFTKGTDIKSKVGTCLHPKPNPNEHYLKAIRFFELGAKAQPEYAELWHNVGACYVFYGERAEALPALHTARDLYEVRLQDKSKMYAFNSNETHNHFWLSCVYALLQEKEKGLEQLRILAEKKSFYYLSLAKNEEDWGEYRQDSDFLHICKSY